jgi:hypothetical protein
MKKIINLSLLLFVFVFISNAQDEKQPGRQPILLVSSQEQLAASIAGKTNGEITREELLNSKGLLLENKPESVSGITSFRITMVEKGNVLGPMDLSNLDNGELTSKMREAIKSAPAGSKIYFEYIKCTNKDGSIRSLSPLNFVLK